METRFYAEKGRPGGEHKLALHASKKAFERITGHLYRKKRLNEEIAKAAAYRNYHKDATKAMTSQWENSVENLRKKKEEARQQRQAQKADDRVERYFKVLKWQAEEREAYNKQVKDKIFQMRGSQRDINSSVLFSECMYVNEKQIEAKNKRKERIAEDRDKFDQQLIKEDEAFKQIEQEKECKKRIAAKEHLEFVKKQIVEKEKIKEQEKKIELEKEKSDIVKQQDEMNMIRKNAEEDFLKTKRCSLKILKESRDEAAKNRQIEEKSDVELQTLCEIFRDTKTQINCVREIMRKKDIQKRLDLQESAFKKLEKIKSQKISNEEQATAKAIAEMNEADAEKKRIREVYEEKLLKERKQNYEDALQSEKRKKEIEREQHKWESLNRMKLMEICSAEEEQRRDNQSKKIEEYRKMLNEQVQENKQVKAYRQAKEDAFKWNDFPERDRMFLEYGAEMIAKQKAAGKSTYPIELAIKEYKKKHSLFPADLKNSCLKNGTNETKNTLKHPSITRRICPTKNDSTGVHDCFCTA